MRAGLLLILSLGLLAPFGAAAGADARPSWYNGIGSTVRILGEPRMGVLEKQSPFFFNTGMVAVGQTGFDRDWKLDLLFKNATGPDRTFETDRMALKFNLLLPIGQKLSLDGKLSVTPPEVEDVREFWRRDYNADTKLDLGLVTELGTFGLSYEEQFRSNHDVPYKFFPGGHDGLGEPERTLRFWYSVPLNGD